MSSIDPWLDARGRIEVANLVPANLIMWPNEEFTQPPPDPPAPWIAVEMTSTVLAPIELLGGEWQEDGILWVHVFVPWGSGTETARTLAKQIANTFRGLEPAPTYYLRASLDAGGRDDNTGIWWRLTVTIEWRYQDRAV